MLSTCFFGSHGNTADGGNLAPLRVIKLLQFLGFLGLNARFPPSILGIISILGSLGISQPTPMV